ncbi:MAG: O-antigen ligase family protein [Pseudomonadota bacterium]
MSRATAKIREAGSARDVVMFWAAAAVTLLAALALGANRPIAWTALSLAALGLGFMSLALSFATGRRARRLGALAPPLFLYALVLLWACLQATPGLFSGWAHPAFAAAGVAAPPLSLDPINTWHGVFRLAAYAALFWIGVQAGRRIGRRLIDVFALWSSLLALYALGAHFTGFNPILGSAEAYDSLEGVFVNRNAYALYAGWGLTACFAAIAHRLRKVPWGERHAPREAIDVFFDGAWIFAIGAFLLMTALLLTASRAGLMATIVSLAVFFTLTRMRRKSGPGWDPTTILALLLGLVVLFISSEAVLSRFSEISDSSDDRMLMYGATLSAIAERPLLGYGLGAYEEGFRPFLPAGWAWGRPIDWDLAHSSYLENFFELGLPAAIAFYAALAMVFLRILRGARERRRMIAPSAFAAALAASGAIHSIVDFPLQMPAITAFLALALGVGWANSWPSERRRNRQAPILMPVYDYAPPGAAPAPAAAPAGAFGRIEPSLRDDRGPLARTLGADGAGRRARSEDADEFDEFDPEDFDPEDFDLDDLDHLDEEDDDLFAAERRPKSRDRDSAPQTPRSRWSMTPKRRRE